MPTLVSTGQITIQDANDIARVALATETVTLSAAADGTVASFAAATTAVQVLQGSTDATSLWTLTKADTSCTSTLSAGTLSVSALTADTGFVVVTATRAGWPTVTGKFTVAKAKAGKDGTNLIDCRWWSPTATWLWTKNDHGPAAESSIVQGVGHNGQVRPLVKCVADSYNKCFTPNAYGASTPAVLTSFWLPAELGGVAPVVAFASTGGWTADGSTTYSGNSISVTKTALTVNSQGIASKAIPVTPGETLRIRVRVRGSTATASGLYIRVNQASAVPAAGAVTSANRLTTGGYTDLVANGACAATYTTYANLAYTVPAGVVAISLAIFSWANGPLTLTMDDPTVNRLAYTDSATGLRESGEGGWTASAAAVRPPIDLTKTYRFVVPVRRDTSGAARIYWGVSATDVCNLNTSVAATTSWFLQTPSSVMTVGEWYLAVGYVYPAGSTGMTSANAGLYRVSTGALVAAGTNLCWNATATSTQHQAWQYYADNGEVCWWDTPALHLVDGTEPPLNSYFPIGINASGMLTGVDAGNGTQVANSKVPNIVNASAAGVGLVWSEMIPQGTAEAWGIEPLVPGDGIEILDSGSTPGVVIKTKEQRHAVMYQSQGQTISTTTMTDIIGWMSLEANCAYIVEGAIAYKMSTTAAGLKVDCWTSQTAGQNGVFSAQTVWNTQDVIPVGNASTATYAANAACLSRFSLLIFTGAACTATMRAAPGAAGTLTIEPGSLLRYQKLGPVYASPPPAVVLNSTLGSAATYSLSKERASLACTASIGVSIAADGSWSVSMTGTGTTLSSSGTPLTGLWLPSVTAGAGASYEVAFVWGATTGTPSLSGGGGTWVSLASAQGVSCYVTAPVESNRSGSAALTVNIRKTGTTTPVCTSTMTLSVAATSIGML